MKKIFTFAICVLLSMSSHAQLSGLLDQAKEVSSDSLTSLLGQQLDADSSQIEGGLGSLFAFAKERFSAGDFDQLAAAIPGVGKYMESAKKMGLLDNPLTSKADLNGALGKLGMSADDISRFVPAALDALGKIGGDDISKMLQSLTAA